MFFLKYLLFWHLIRPFNLIRDCLHKKSSSAFQQTEHSSGQDIVVGETLQQLCLQRRYFSSSHDFLEDMTSQQAWHLKGVTFQQARHSSIANQQAWALTKLESAAASPPSSPVYSPLLARPFIVARLVKQTKTFLTQIIVSVTSL